MFPGILSDEFGLEDGTGAGDASFKISWIGAAPDLRVDVEEDSGEDLSGRCTNGPCLD